MGLKGQFDQFIYNPVAIWIVLILFALLFDISGDSSQAELNILYLTMVLGKQRYTTDLIYVLFKLNCLPPSNKFSYLVAARCT